jgi:hypothetical protein
MMETGSGSSGLAIDPAHSVSILLPTLELPRKLFLLSPQVFVAKNKKILTFVESFFVENKKIPVWLNLEEASLTSTTAAPLPSYPGPTVDPFVNTGLILTCFFVLWLLLYFLPVSHFCFSY